MSEKSEAMFKRALYIFIIGVLTVACGQESGDRSLVSGDRSLESGDRSRATGARILEEAEAALAGDSIRQGETLLRRAIKISEESEDWHTNYIAHQRLAEALSQGNPEEALRLMKKALTVYDQHPDDERNKVMLLDYAGTYAAQVAYNTDGSYDEALDFIHVLTTSLRKSR